MGDGQKVGCEGAAILGPNLVANALQERESESVANMLTFEIPEKLRECDQTYLATC